MQRPPWRLRERLASKKAGLLEKAMEAASKMREKRVDEHIGGSRVESKYLPWLARARKNRDVGNTAEIQRNAAKFCVAVEKIVTVGNKRRALPAECDIPGPKIANSGDARARSNNRWLANL